MTSASVPVSIDESYARCVALTRQRARNFHYAFKVLPEERYRGICALYAFSRLADDFSDDESDPERALAQARQWRAALDRTLAGDPGAHPVLPALADTLRRYEIPPQYLHELITGTEMDAHTKRYATWEETRLYCYRVASVIGIMTIHVFGFKGGRDALELAEKNGIAFQLTNILRDLAEDARRDRIYLPLEDLQAHGVSEAELLAARDTPRLRVLVQAEVERCKPYYEQGQALVELVEPASRPAFASLLAIYRRLLLEIERRKYDVFTRRVSLSTAEKLRLAAGFALKNFLGAK